MTKPEKIVLKLHLFNAISAVGGGIAPMTGVLAIWYTPTSSNA